MTASVLDRVDRLHRDLRTGRRAYAMTPPRLRRPEPAMRAATAAITVWFAAMFLALGLSGTGDAPATVGFLCAATVGGVGTTLVAVRRVRLAIRCLVAMLVLGQIVAMLGLR